MTHRLFPTLWSPFVLSIDSLLCAELRHRTRGVLLAGVMALVAVLPMAAQAEPIPWRQRQHIDLPATNEPLNVVLGRLFTLSGLAANTSASIASAKVNGRLQGSAETIFRELSETYGLTWYFDGSTVYIYSLTEMESRMLQVSPADVPRVERTLREMRLLDPRFQLRSSATEGQLFVSGPPQYVQVVADVAARVASAPSQVAQPHQVDTRVFRLRHARAADTVVNIGGTETTIPGVARILNEVMGSAGSDTSSQPASRTLPVTMTGLRGKGLASVGREGSAPGAAVPGTSTVVGSEIREIAGNQQGSARSATETVVRADPRINAVIVRDLQDRMGTYERLVTELDVSMPLLEIEATVIDVSQDKSQQLGVDWRLHGRRADVSSSPNGLAGTGRGTPNDANDLIYSMPPRSAGNGLVGTLLFGNDRTNFLARINALTENGDANLISKPRVLTMNNTEAVLQSTQDFFVRVAGRESTDLFNVSMGLMLRVTPTLIEDAQGPRIKLNIRIEDGNTQSGSQVDQIPVVNRNAIATQAVVGDGHSLLIGGYTIDEKTQGKAGVPVLSEVPGLQWLFGQKNNGTRRVERMFMITPRLVLPDEVQPSAAAVAAKMTGIEQRPSAIQQLQQSPPPQAPDQLQQPSTAPVKAPPVALRADSPVQ